ncbi:MAG: hypothetical protein ACODAG_10570 [Myxococcota bacterium]
MIAALAFGCSDDDPPPPADGGDDGGAQDSGPPPVTCGGDPSHVFLVSSLVAGEEDPEGVAPGVNLDDREDNDHCVGQSPSAPLVDYEWPDGTWGDETGIDNRLAILVELLKGFDTDLNQTLVEGMGSGEIVILAKMGGVDDLQNDDCIALSLLLGFLPEDADTCDDDGDGVINYFDVAPGDADVAEFNPDLTIDLNEEAFDPETMEPLINVEGAIEDGVVTAGPTDITLTLPLDEETELALTLGDAQVTFDVTETGITDGLIAGTIGLDDLAEAGGAALDIPPDDLKTVLGQEMDMNPDPDDGDRCQGMSAGLMFEGLPATEGETVAESAAMECSMPDGGTDGGGTDGGGTDGGGTDGGDTDGGV